MIHDRINKIEMAVHNAPTLSGESKQELLGLLSDLKVEIAPLMATHPDDLASLARFADASVHESLRSNRKESLATAARKGLVASVEGFEATHPRLVQTVDRIAVALSNMGI